MPTIDEMRLKGPEVHEKILQQLHRMDQNLQAMGLGPMLADQMRGAYEKIKAAVTQLVTQPPQAPQASPQSAPQRPIPTQPYAPSPQVPMSQLAEGGFVNDSSGVRTEELRNRLGIR